MTDSNAVQRSKPKAIVFDLSETLLDMSALDPLFADAFGDKGVRRTWFAQTISNVLLATLLGTYAEFGDVQRAALEMTAKRRGVAIDPERVRRILRGALALPAHGDVHGALARIGETGIRLAILANATREAVEAQLDNARLRPYFEVVMSADEIRRYKPAPEPYALAAERLALGPDEILFASAHDWDVTGALKAGYRAVFVARHGTSLNPLEAPPEGTVPDIRTLADVVASTVPA